MKLLSEKWISILYHMKNVKEWEYHSLFKEYAHVQQIFQKIKLKALLKELSFAYAALKKIALDKSLLNEFKYMTDFNHTATLEVYPSLQSKYSHKRLHFYYSSMFVREELSVLDFKSKVGLAHRENKQGDLQYKHQFSKITQSWVVKKNTNGKKRKRINIISWMR